MSGLRDWLKEKMGTGDDGDDHEEPPATPAPESEAEKERESFTSPATPASAEEMRLMRLARYQHDDERKNEPEKSEAAAAEQPPAKKTKSAAVLSTPTTPTLQVAPRAFAASSPIDTIGDPDEWTHHTLLHVFAVKQPGESPPRLTMLSVDLALLDTICSRVPHEKTADYLYACFHRVRHELDQVLNKRDPSRMSQLNVMLRATVIFAAVFFASPNDSFPRKSSDRGRRKNQLLPFLDSGNTDELVAIVEPLVCRDLPRHVGPKLLLCERQADMLYRYRCLSSVLALNASCQTIVHLSAWTPAVRTGREFEKQSILGPFFSPSSYPDSPHVGDALLLNKTTREEIFPVFDRLRHRFGVLQGSLKYCVLECLKLKTARPAMLRWMIQAVNLNLERTHMRPNYKDSSTHGFLLNFGAVCMELCEPVGKKVGTIDAKYCLQNSGIDFSKDTRLVYSDSDLAAASGPTAAPSFNTEIFWITARALSVGFRPAAQYYEGICNALRDREQKLSGDPGNAGLQLAVKLTLKDKLAAEAHVKRPEFLVAACGFYDMVARFFTSTADPERTGSWPAKPVADICCLPQWLLDDLMFFYEWLGRHASDILQTGAHHQSLLSFLTLVLANSYGPPHVLTRITEVLQCLIPSRNNGLPADMFGRNKFVQTLLIPALVRWYVDCERTGSHNAYYEKFSIRYRISEIIEYLWNLQTTFRDAMLLLCHNDSVFLQFMTLMLNDSVYLLDEALSNLEQIHKLEASASQSQDELEKLHQLTRSTRSYNLLSNASMKMFRDLSSHAAETFMKPELIDRLAAMLNYFLVALAGPKCSELKVKRPEAVNFDPKFLLRTLCTTFANFGNVEAFRVACVRDERSYSQQVFVAAAGILRNRIAGVSDAEVVRFEVFCRELELTASSVEENEPWEDDDIPEEFLDPVMATLMRDPVTWGEGNTIMDRSIIQRQLLNDPHDPFTRAPLESKDLRPVIELRARVQQWIADQKLKDK